MVDTGYKTNTGKLVIYGDPPTVIEKNVETATGMYPGFIAMPGTTKYDVILSDGTKPISGVIGYEHTGIKARKDSISTIYAADDKIAILKGTGYTRTLKLAIGTSAVEGDDMYSWKDGVVVPCVIINGCPAVKIPFVKNASEKDTGVEIPTGAIVHDCFIDVTTAVAGSSIDVGILSGEAGGDADGFLDGEACTAAGVVVHNLVDATAANITLGALLVESDIIDATGTPVYVSIKNSPGHICDGTAITVSYTTSSHAVVGNILLLVSGDGITYMGKAGKDVDNSAGSSAADIPVEA